MSLNVNKSKDDNDEGAKLFATERNHQSVANLCLAVVRDLGHLAWRKAQFTLRERVQHDGESQGTQTDLALRDIFDLLLPEPVTTWTTKLPSKGWFSRLTDFHWDVVEEDGFAVYVLLYWTKHINAGYSKTSIFDSFWINVLNLALSTQNTALLGSILARSYFEQRYELLPTTVFGSLRKGPNYVFTADRWFADYSDLSLVLAETSPKLLPIHIFAKEFCFLGGTTMTTADFQKFNVPSVNSNEGRLEAVLRLGLLKSVSGDTAMHVACTRGNRVFAEFLLLGTQYLKGETAAYNLLFVGSDSGDGSIPINACQRRKAWKDTVATQKLLLEFENNYMAEPRRSERANHGIHDKRQLKHKFEGKSVFFNTLQNQLESVIFTIFDLAKPEDYKSTDGDRNTPLHIATGRGLVSVMRHLTALDGTNINAQNASRETPLFVAAVHNQDEALKYLLSLPGILRYHGADVRAAIEDNIREGEHMNFLVSDLPAMAGDLSELPREIMRIWKTSN